MVEIRDISTDQTRLGIQPHLQGETRMCAAQLCSVDGEDPKERLFGHAPKSTSVENEQVEVLTPAPRGGDG